MTTASASDLERARLLLDDARRLDLARGRAEIDGASGLMNRCRDLLSSHVAELVARVEQSVALYDGLPAPINPLDLLGVAENEPAHTRILAWLLDPAATHGLGDDFLRRFLSRTAAQDRALDPDELHAVVRAECQLAHGYVDILVVLRGLVIVVENKVWDVEHDIDWRGARPQATSYLEQMRDPSVRAGVLQGLGAASLTGPNPTVIGAFVHPEGTKGAKDAPPAIADVTWLDVERDLASSLRRRNVRAEARTFLEAFRTNLLEASGSTDDRMARIVALRRLVDLSRGRPMDPLRLYLELSVLTPSTEEP